MISGANIKRRVAVSISLCIVLAQLAPSIAAACEGGEGRWLRVTDKKGGKEENPCTFTRVGDLCEVTWESTVALELEIERSKLEGERAAERYRVVRERCPGSRRITERFRCTDEIEMIRLERNTQNEYCLYVKDERTGRRVLECEILRM